jgi:hypothetical protein
MQNTEITATSPNLAELAARELVNPPENLAVSEVGREQVKPPEAQEPKPTAASADNININVFNPEAPKPESPVVTSTPHPVADAAVTTHPLVQGAIQVTTAVDEKNPLLVSEEEVKKAEEQLFAYIGAHVAPSLLAGTKEHPIGLTLKLTSEASKDVVLVLNFSGPNIDANYGTYEKNIGELISQHPVLGAVLPRGMANQPNGDNTLRAALGQLKPEQYVALIRELAAPQKAAGHAPVQPIKDAEITAATSGVELSDMHVAEGGSLVDAAGHAINAEAPPGINNADTKIEVPVAQKEIIKPQQQVVEV